MEKFIKMKTETLVETDVKTSTMITPNCQSDSLVERLEHRTVNHMPIQLSNPSFYAADEFLQTVTVSQ